MIVQFEKRQIADLILERARQNELGLNNLHILYDRRMNDIFAGQKKPTDGFIFVCSLDALDRNSKIKRTDAKSEYVVSSWLECIEFKVSFALSEFYESESDCDRKK